MIGTFFFLSFFLLVLAWVAFGGKARFESAARLPLDEGRPVSSESTAHCLPEPTHD